MTSLGSYVSSVNKSGNSSRTTIPIPIVKALSLTNKDKIIWDLRVDADGLTYAIVRKEKL